MTSLLLAATLPSLALPPFRPAPREFRAVWIATVDNIDWPSKKTLTTQQQQAELVRAMDVAERAGLNAVVFQVRTSCDALYASSLEPWSEFLTGRQGRSPEPFWDPLRTAIELAHARGMELHAWINPYRARHFKATGPLSEGHVSRTKPDIVRSYGRYLWMDPGEPGTRRHTLQVAVDLVERYDLDGIHYDDYFYPYAEKGADGKAIPFPDNESYSRYRQAGGTLDLKDWRRQNVNDFVKELYRSVKAAKPSVKVGVSPFGIWRPGHPKGIVAGIDQYDDPLYADCRLWLREGWLDYFTPQLYWPLDSAGQPYGKLLDWWAGQNVKGRHLWPGNYTGRVSPSNGNWAVEEVVGQIERTRKQKGAGGNVHFSLKCFLQNDKRIATILGQGLYKPRALVPASPWLGSAKPVKPQLSRIRGGGEVSLRWKPVPGARFYAMYRLRNGVWSLSDVIPGEADSMLLSQSDYAAVDGFALTALGATGIESEPSLLAK